MKKYPQLIAPYWMRLYLLGLYLLSLCLFGSSALVYAADWEHILDADGGQVFVDLDSYGDDAVYSTITTKTHYATALKTQTKPHKAYTTKLVKAQFDCKQHSMNILSIVLLDKHAKVVDKQTPTPRMLPLAGNTSDKGVETLVCQVRKMMKG